MDIKLGWTTSLSICKEDCNEILSLNQMDVLLEWIDKGREKSIDWIVRNIIRCRSPGGLRYYVIRKTIIIKITFGEIYIFSRLKAFTFAPFLDCAMSQKYTFLWGRRKFSRLIRDYKRKTFTSKNLSFDKSKYFWKSLCTGDLFYKTFMGNLLIKKVVVEQESHQEDIFTLLCSIRKKAVSLMSLWLRSIFPFWLWVCGHERWNLIPKLFRINSKTQYSAPQLIWFFFNFCLKHVFNK